MRSCALFTCYCSTCEKSRFNDKFSLCLVLCLNLRQKRKECTNPVGNSFHLHTLGNIRMENWVSYRSSTVVVTRWGFLLQSVFTMIPLIKERLSDKLFKISIFTTTPLKWEKSYRGDRIFLWGRCHSECLKTKEQQPWNNTKQIFPERKQRIFLLYVICVHILWDPGEVPVHEVLSGIKNPLISGQIVNSFGQGKCTFDCQAGNFKNYSSGNHASKSSCMLRIEKLIDFNGSFENEALENEDRSTKHPMLKNEAPKSRKRGTQISKTKHPRIENEAPKTRNLSVL